MDAVPDNCKNFKSALSFSASSTTNLAIWISIAILNVSASSFSIYIVVNLMFTSQVYKRLLLFLFLIDLVYSAICIPLVIVLYNLGSRIDCKSLKDIVLASSSWIFNLYAFSFTLLALNLNLRVLQPTNYSWLLKRSRWDFFIFITLTFSTIFTATGVIFIYCSFLHIPIMTSGIIIHLCTINASCKRQKEIKQIFPLGLGPKRLSRRETTDFVSQGGIAMSQLQCRVGDIPADTRKNVYVPKPEPMNKQTLTVRLKRTVIFPWIKPIRPRRTYVKLTVVILFTVCYIISIFLFPSAVTIIAIHYDVTPQLFRITYKFLSFVPVFNCMLYVGQNQEARKKIVRLFYCTKK